jgi:hypothetical protein
MEHKTKRTPLNVDLRTGFYLSSKLMRGSGLGGIWEVMQLILPDEETTVQCLSEVKRRDISIYSY